MPEPPAGSELAAEQRHIDAAYARLDAMRRAAERVSEGYADVQRGGTHQARLERDVAEAYTRRRLAMFDIGDAPLCFGRLDLVPGEHGTEPPLYIGRISVGDDDLTPLVIDWRAPVAEPFYRATAVEPMGVARRRHFQTQGRCVLGLDDEVFDADAARDAGYGIVGEGALLAALERERSGRMRDIVATIQSEQDEAIRAPAPGVLVVAGGPGTGKTAVALHRAAYLLYTYRPRLASQGVLLVGPNPIFLRYIDEVLPSLGEDDVVLGTPATLKPGYRIAAEDLAVVATVKGDARMARVIAAAVGDRERPMPRDVVARIDGFQLRMRRRDSARIIERARTRRGTHNERRPVLTGMVVDHFRREYRRALIAAYREGRSLPEGGSDRLGPAGADPTIAASLARGEHTPEVQEWEAELTGRLRRLPEVRAALDRMWPVLDGAELLNDLFGFTALIASAADGVLTPEESGLLFRERDHDVADVAWTSADLALVDEADAVLGPREAARNRPRTRPRRDAALEAARRTVRELGVGGFLTAEDVLERYGGDAPLADADDGGIRTFGHVLVDEAQDLSAMQWRMLARRCPSGSMTLVGDFGQSSRAGAVADWDAALEHLPARTVPRRVALSVNYRTPAEIMEVANRLLAAAAPGVEPARPVRHTGAHPEVRSVSADGLVADAADAARRAIASGGTVAVIAPSELHAALVAALADRGAVADAPEAIDAPVAVITALDSKGLEFDSVVVVEPARLVAPDAAGLRMLYVVLTRATRHLTVVHAEPLPEALELAGRSLGA